MGQAGPTIRFATRANCFHGAWGRDPDAWWRAACRLGAVATLAARGQPTFLPAAPGGSESARIRRVSPVPGPRGRDGPPDRPRRMAWTNALLKAGSAQY